MQATGRKGLTTREAVVQAALTTTDALGLDALTIREVARQAQVAPMTIYSYVSSKHELLELMYAAALSELYRDTDEPTWQRGYAALCRQIRRTLLSHPNWVPLLSLGNQPLTQPYRERLIVQMTSDAVPQQQAAVALSNAGLMAVGFVLAELVYRDPNGQSALTHKLLRFQRWTRQGPRRSDAPPNQVRMDLRERFDLDAQFDAVVQNYVIGLESARSARTAAEPLE